MREHKRRGDLVVDVDALYQAVTGLEEHQCPRSLHDAVLGCKRFLLGWLERNPETDAWIIACAPLRIQRSDIRNRFGAEVTVLEVPEGECLARIGSDPSRSEHAELWREWVHAWWTKYEPAAEDAVIRDGVYGHPVVVRTRRVKAV